MARFLADEDLPRSLVPYLVAAGIVAAELHRVRTGEGQLISLSLADVALSITGHLGLIAMIVGRRIKWDVKKEVIVGDAEASKLLTRAFRKPWKLAGV